jgi:hypothetical protein
MRKAVATGIVALAAGMVFSGCFYLRTLHFSEDRTEVGKPVTAVIGLQPAGEDPSYFLVVLAAPAPDLLALGNGTMDPDGLHGGPYPLVKDEEGLAGQLEADETCDLPFATTKGTTSFVVRRTEDEVTRNGLKRLTEARVKVRPLAEGKGGVMPLAVLTADWEDNGDGDPHADEVRCTGLASSSLVVK